ncbi:MAG: hypothetical protein JOZ72_01120 [Alphaproteobacteria bacterium]|nr:hypothetical protein [Alphaproteobacteria bacterium]
MRRFAYSAVLAALGTALAGLALATPAAAQIQPDVTVNPNASGTRVLLYPGGKYGRVQRELLQPGDPYPGLPIVLHMPRKHHALHRVATAKPKPRTPKVELAAAPPPSSPPVRSQTTSIPKESAASLLMDEMAKEQAAPARPAPVAAKPAPVVARPAPPKQQVASVKPQVAAPKPSPAKPAAAPAPKQDDTFGVVSGNQVQQPETKTASIDTSVGRNSIMFAPGAEEPPVSAIDSIKGMTASLNAALWSGTAHIQLEAFGGKPNDKSSDARRLSLKRALIVRQLLIDDGIPSERIVVRAMGGAPSGAPDRVDIFVAA